MFKNISLKLSCVFFFAATFAVAQDWSWAGFEVIGNHSVSREEILKLVPIKVEGKYEEDAEAWKQWCGQIIKKFDFVTGECSAVRYSSFKAYFVVDIVEKGQEYRAKFRAAPSQSIPLADAAVLATFKKLQDRLWHLFSLGTPSPETWEKGYLDYADPQMHVLVLELVKSAPAHRENILKVLKDDRDPVTRMAAADLLNWAGQGADSVLRSHALLDDPHSGVRNQLSRFMIHFSGSLKEEKDFKAVIDSLLVQLDRPSFGDRNKSLFTLLEILKARPDLAPYLKAQGLPLLRYVAENSILENVVGPAREILAKL